jgi:hypothetical protein
MHRCTKRWRGRGRSGDETAPTMQILEKLVNTNVIKLKIGDPRPPGNFGLKFSQKF